MKPNKKIRIASAKAIIITMIIMVIAWILQSNFCLVINRSESLPLHAVLVKKGKIPTKIDQIFVFKVRNNLHYKMQEMKFIKLVGGLPGDKIEVRGGDFFVGDKVLKNEAIGGDDSMYHAIRLAEIMQPEHLTKRGIKLTNKEIYVGGRYIGIVKPYSKKLLEEIEVHRNDKSKDIDKLNARQFALYAMAADEIPPGKYFAYTPHKDSFDSRYQDLGLIDASDIIGTAIASF